MPVEPPPVSPPPLPAPAAPPAAPPAPPKPPAPPSAPAAPAPGESDDPWASVDNDVKPLPKEPAPAPAPAPKPAAAPPAAPAKAAVVLPPAESPKQLREAKARAEQDAQTAQIRVKELERLYADATAKGKDTDALSQRLAAAEKESARLDSELRMARYEKSDAVKAAEKGLDQAARSARRIIESLEVTRSDGTIVPAKWGDFMTLVSTLDPGPALKAIREQYGDNATLAIQQYFEITKHSDSVDTAQAEDRAGFEERVTRETATKKMQEDGFAKMVKTISDDMISKNPEFAPSPDDPEADAIFKKSSGLADLAFSRQVHSLTPKEQAIMLANVKHRAASAPRLQFKLNRANAKIAALEAENAELRGGTAPPEARPGGSDHAPTEKTFEQDLEEASQSFIER